MVLRLASDIPTVEELALAWLCMGRDVCVHQGRAIGPTQTIVSNVITVKPQGTLG